MVKQIRLSNKFKWLLVCIALALISAMLACVRVYLVNKPQDQYMAKRWSTSGGVSQISCFFSQTNTMTEDRLIEYGHQLDDELVQASIVNESENETARLWACAYSEPGAVTVSTERASVSVDVLGVGGDFFLFHPQKLLYGSYFSGNDINQDYVLLDEEIAWQLYGASDIAGQIVIVDNRPHVVSGVFQRPEGKLEKAAGLDSPLMFLSVKSLETSQCGLGINHFEIVMPNPIKGFAMEKISQGFDGNDQNTMIVENTGRFSVLSSLKVLQQFATRSMNGKAIVYPYWENIARGYEDIIALVTLFMLLFALVPIVSLILWLIGKWKRKKWTLRSIYEAFVDKIYVFQSKNREKKARRREKKIAEKVIKEDDEAEEDDEEEEDDEDEEDQEDDQ